MISRREIISYADIRRRSIESFGFIEPDNGGEDAFVHVSAIKRAGMNDVPKDRRSASSCSPILGRAKCRRKSSTPFERGDVNYADGDRGASTVSRK